MNEGPACIELDPSLTLLHRYTAFGSDEEAIAELDRLDEPAHDPDASP